MTSACSEWPPWIIELDHFKNIFSGNFYIQTVQHLDIIKVFYLPTDAQVNCRKNNFKIYIKTAPNDIYMQPHHRINHTDVF
jgi:hypothetical protein